MIGSGNIGYQSQASNNMVIVNGSGSVFTVLNELDIGRAGVGGKLLITNGGSVVASNVIVGVNATSVSNVVNNCGGFLVVTNASATGTLDLRRGTLFLNSDGSLTVDRLLLSSGSSGVMAFLGGSLNTKGTSITNGQVFVVGDGTDAATFRLQGGMHSFANGMEISNNATLTGCGTISGNVLVDPGGQVIIDCGGLLTFTGTVTNNGTIRAINGSALEVYGTVVNNGVIDIIDGGTNFHSAFINNGIVLDANSDSDGDGMSNLEEIIAGTDPTNSASVFRISGIASEGDDMRVTWTMGSGKTNALQVATDGTGDFSTNNFSDIFTVTNTIGNVTNYLDVGGAANAPARFYRVRLVP
jgi:T5SS/PEP-CTERM-associated repeat protein